VIRTFFCYLIGILAISILSGCASNGDSKQPLTVNHYGVVHSAGQLVVFFPGINSPGEDFNNNNFLSPFIKKYPQTDILLVDTRLAYFNAGNIANRIQQEIVIPAKKAGYKNIWFVGTSLGGLGTLIYNKNYPGTIDGIVLIAPFLGEEDIVDSIQGYSSPDEWAREEINNKSDAVQMWRYLINFNGQKINNNTIHVKLILAFGDGDRFNYAHQLLASLMESKNVYSKPGGHNWSTWYEIWLEILNKNVLNTYN
jgi:pimeloyl-ACP methyl ester carboxylesterase